MARHLFKCLISNSFVFLFFLTLVSSSCSTKQPEKIAKVKPCPPPIECPPVPKIIEVIDSRLSFDEATAGVDIPERVLEKLTILEVKYLGFDKKIHRGQLICKKEEAGNLSCVFDGLLQDSFPIERVVPISVYGWDDQRSMTDNNTSCFNYRSVLESGSLSEHGYGHAIDINPRLNPFFPVDKPMEPANGVYDTLAPGTIYENSPIIQRFRKIGWEWGGFWRRHKDYQHFSKNGG